MSAATRRPHNGLVEATALRTADVDAVVEALDSARRVDAGLLLHTTSPLAGEDLFERSSPGSVAECGELPLAWSCCGACATLRRRLQATATLRELRPFACEAHCACSTAGAARPAGIRVFDVDGERWTLLDDAARTSSRERAVARPVEAA